MQTNKHEWRCGQRKKRQHGGGHKREREVVSKEEIKKINNLENESGSKNSQAFKLMRRRLLKLNIHPRHSPDKAAERELQVLE